MAKERKQRARIPIVAGCAVPPWAEGAREDILQPHLDVYSRARDMGWIAEREYLQKFCNKFHAHVNWRLQDHEELGPFDTDTTVVEEEDLDDAEEVQQRARVEEINTRIHRWFIYCIDRCRRQSAGLDPRKDPFAILLAKLLGLSTPPKARQAYQQFMRESYTNAVAPVVAERWTAARANNEPETVGAQRSRAKCLDALPNFIAPILRGIYDYTGCHSVLIVGGPMPKYGDDLRTMHVSSGTNKTAARVHFPPWDRERFNVQVLKFFGDYLHTAFSTADYLNTALPADMTQAKYIIPVDGLESDSDDSDSSDSDSDSDSDDSLQPPAKKTEKADKKDTGTCGAAPGERQRVPVEEEQAPMGTTTVDTPLGPVTFKDPTAGIPYDDLSPKKQRVRNVLRNKVLGQMMWKDIASVLEPGAPSTPVAEPTTRRLHRLAVQGKDVPDPGNAMDIDVPRSCPLSPPASASEPHTPLPDDDLMDLDGENSRSDLEQELNELESSDHDSRPNGDGNGDGKASGKASGNNGNEGEEDGNEVDEGDRDRHGNTSNPDTNVHASASERQSISMSQPPPCPEKAAPWFVNAHEGPGQKLGDWGVVRGVVAGLYFWGCAIVDLPDLQDNWEVAVQDVSWILEGLAAFHKKFKRR
ncbi:hypothetical protein B0H19DRAFT_1058947 [Mycena capillaripes]|nr:hypothetical protein B0H19DRAFT_1058947 [Mycena capillaripes]